MSNIPCRCNSAYTLWSWAVGLAAASIFAITPANAAVTFGGSAAGNDAGETNSATATFALSVSGTTTDLVITLTNTADYKPNDPPDMLTAVFFTLAGDPTLTKVSGLLGAGSGAVESGTNLTIAGGVIGGSWAYAAGLRGAPGGANEGISSTAYSFFGPCNLFPGSKLPGDCNPPDGVAGGLTSVIDDGSKYDGGLKGLPFIKDSAVFTLSCVPASFSLPEISNVSFSYGSIPDQVIAAMLVPEPSVIALTGAGLLFLGVFGRKRR
ncbi:MAG: XDD4 family exosortase-dependent surface protein [Verrucomicrobiia bacterium]|jgi:hypothetical protein